MKDMEALKNKLIIKEKELMEKEQIAK